MTRRPSNRFSAADRNQPEQSSSRTSPHQGLPVGGHSGPPLELGDTAQGHRRIVALTGGTFSGPEMSGRLLPPSASADWQIILPDGTALGDIRYVLQTGRGDLLYVQSRSIRHGSPEVLERLGRGEDVDPNEYTFRTSTEIETTASDLDWLNKGVFISVAGRQAAGVIYETYLVG
jgi:hypothetical protein